MRIIKMITQRKMLYIFYKQILSTNSLTRCVEVSLETLYLHFVVLRVIKIIWDSECTKLYDPYLNVKRVLATMTAVATKNVTIKMNLPF